MKQETQVAILRDTFRAIERGAPPMAEAPSGNDPAIYVSAERAARERDVLFRRHPLVVSFSSRLRRAGDFVADPLGVVPVLVVRQVDGGLKAFVNACRHRGSRLVAGCGRAERGFTCPYHAWSYETDGRLADVPDEYGFPGLDRSRHGLVELPVAERHGLVWVLPTPGGSISVESVLDGLAEDFETYGLEEYELVDTRLLHPRINWKLASDTFWEAYHLKVLHRKTIAKLFLRNLAVFHAFGRSHRFIGVRKSVETLRARPEREWDLLPHATILMNLFPNTIAVVQSDHFEVYRIFPGETPSESTVEVNLLAPPATAGDPRWREVMALLLGVVDEDFTNGETIQRNFETGLLDHVVYGRYEQGLEHFHRSIREALAER